MSIPPAQPTLPPSMQVANRYGGEFRELGATIDATGAREMDVRFDDAWTARYAGETLRAVVDGVRMIYRGPEGEYTPDLLSSPIQQADFLTRLDAVTGFRFTTNDLPRSPVQLIVAPGADRAKLDGLIAPEFEGTRTKVSFVDSPAVAPEG